MDNDATRLRALQAHHLTSDKKVTIENMVAPISLQDKDCRQWRYIFTVNVAISIWPSITKALT